MYQLEIITEDLIRIVVPYKDIFTTMYILKSPAGPVLFDAASSDEDMTENLVPAMAELGLTPRDLRAVFVSHNHRDHAGGLGYLSEAAPEAVIVSRCPQLKERFGDRVLAPEDGDPLLEVFRVVTIPGHTADSAALLDTRTGILVTGDCLQLFGIYGSGEWGANITLPAEHLAAVEKVRAMAVSAVYCAHDYHPCGHWAAGADVNRALDACVEPLLRIRDLLLAHPALEDAEIRACYHRDVHLPTVPLKVVAAMRQAITEGKIAHG